MVYLLEFYLLFYVFWYLVGFFGLFLVYIYILYFVWYVCFVFVFVICWVKILVCLVFLFLFSVKFGVWKGLIFKFVVGFRSCYCVLIWRFFIVGNFYSFKYCFREVDNNVSICKYRFCKYWFYKLEFVL